MDDNAVTTTPTTPPTITRQDRLRMLREEWRSEVEAAGFTRRESGRLLFIAWLVARGRVQS